MFYDSVLDQVHDYEFEQVLFTAFLPTTNLLYTVVCTDCTVCTSYHYSEFLSSVVKNYSYIVGFL